MVIQQVIRNNGQKLDIGTRESPVGCDILFMADFDLGP